MDRTNTLQFLRLQVESLRSLAHSELGASDTITFALSNVQTAITMATAGQNSSTVQFDTTAPNVTAEDAVDATDEQVIVGLPETLETAITTGAESDDEIAEAVERVRASAPEIAINREDLQFVNDDGELEEAEVPELGVFAEVPTENGSVIVGDESLFDEANQIATEAGFEDGTPEITITYERLDGERFTDEQLSEVLESAVSTKGLDRLGARTMIDNAVDPDNHSVQVTRWFAADGDVSLAALRARCVMYQGEMPFPGIGLVAAKASPVGE